MRRIATQSLLAGLLLSTATFGLDAQGQTVVPKFEIEATPMGLKGDVRPRQYVGVIGRASAWLGQETGEAELWVHPLKLASDFQLDFSIPDYMEPVRGSDVARTVEVRPEITTITYSHATFTVRQHILAPVSEPGLIILLDVETFRPLDIIVSFRTVFQYAWPGSFGGQYAFWNDSTKAFVLSESLQQRNALIGSPWASRASTHPAHSIPDAPNTFVIPVDTARARNEFIPIVVAAGIASRDSVTRLWGKLLHEAEPLYRQKLEHVNQLIENSASIDTPDDALDLAFDWSKVNLDEALACNPDLGCGLVAGWGPSGTGTRPGFGWFFGGDAAINSFAMDATGQWSEVAQGLEFLARYQRDDGKIPHEISQSAGRLPWFDGTFPYTYYHADTTPYWIVAVWRYWRASGDNQLLERIWPAVLRAYSWCLTRDTDDDGIIENGPNNLGAIEIGELGVGMHQDIYLAAVWIEALEAMEDMALAAGDERLSRAAGLLRTKAAQSLNSSYWRESEGHYAFGILESGGTNDNLTVWPATAAAFGLLQTDRAERTLVKLAADSISADWGARILSTGSSLYDPMHYNNGAVWPFVTGFVTWGQYNYRRPWSAFPLIDAIKQVTFDWSRGCHPELMSGRYYRPLDTAVPQQFFATSMLITPLLSGMVGWEPDAPKRRGRLSPQLPPSWRDATVTGLRLGQTVVNAAFQQDTGSFTATIESIGPDITLELAIPVPLGARNVDLEMGPIQEGLGGGLATQGLHDSQYLVPIPLSNSTVSVTVHWTGGLTVEPPTVDLEPGQESRGARILDFRATETGGWSLTVEGEAGAEKVLRLHGEQIRVAGGAATTEFAEGVNTLTVSFPSGTQRRTVSIMLVPASP